jgi:hypothetical protein
MDNEIDALVNELQNDNTMTTLSQPNSAEELKLTDENVNDFILETTGKLVQSGLKTIESLKSVIQTGFDPEELTAYSDLMKSVITAVDTLNKVNLQNKKGKTSKEIKQMEINNKVKESKGGNTNVLVMTREDVIKNFLDKNKEELKGIIDIKEK